MSYGELLFKVKVRIQESKVLRAFHFYAESWEEALAFARQKGEPVSIEIAK